MEIFESSKGFPKEEKYSLTDQIQRSSRSVTACIAESWAKRRYEKAFVSKVTIYEVRKMLLSMINNPEKWGL